MSKNCKRAAGDKIYFVRENAEFCKKYLRSVNKKVNIRAVTSGFIWKGNTAMAAECEEK